MANLKKNLAYNFLLSISQVLIPFVSIPYIARVLDPEGIGRVSFIDSFTYYFLIIAEFGIVVYGVREVARTQHDALQLRKTVSELLALHLISSSGALLLYGITVYVCWQNINDVRLLLFSLSFLLVNFFACEWYFWGRERFRYITIRSLITRLLGLASIFVLIKQPDDYYLYYGIMVGAAIANLLWNMYTLFREVPVSFKGLNWKQHVRFSSVIFILSLFSGITLLLDNVLLGLVSTTAAVGLYAYSIKFVRIGSALLTDMFLVLYPRTVALMQQQDKAAVQRAVLKSVQLVTLLAIPAGMGMFLLADPLVQLFLGDKFLAVRENLKIIALLPFIKAYSVLLSKQVLIANDREKLFLRSVIVGGVLFIVLTLLLSYFYQDKGACIAIMIAEGVIMGFNYYYARQTAPFLSLFHWRTAGEALTGSLLFIPIVWLVERIHASPAVVLGVAVASCITVYFLFLLFILRNAFVRSVVMTTRRQSIYFLQEHLHRQVVHGGIGNIDAEKVLLSKGYQPLSFPCIDDFSLLAKWKRCWFLLVTWLTLPAGASVVFQLPLYPRMSQWLLRLLARRKSIKLIGFVADIDGLKDGDEGVLQSEKKLLRLCSAFIVHNQAMEDWLKSFIPGKMIEQIEFFDFLATPVRRDRHSEYEVVFAGNLAKSKFLLQLGELQNQQPPVRFVLYGAGMEQVTHWPSNVVYKGVYDPYQLPHALEGTYGLVWDGDSIDGCAGSLGHYMAYISHHKLSLYLVAGLPVITAKKAASAALVEKYGIGYAVDNLHEIATLISQTDAATYQRMAQNSRALAAKITQGKCLGEALDKLESRMSHKQ